MFGDASQHGAKVEFRIEPVELRRTDKAVHGGSTFSAAIGSCEQEVFDQERRLVAPARPRCCRSPRRHHRWSSECFPSTFAGHRVAAWIGSAGYSASDRLAYHVSPPRSHRGRRSCSELRSWLAMRGQHESHGTCVWHVPNRQPRRCLLHTGDESLRTRPPGELP